MPYYYLFRCSTGTYQECINRKWLGQTLNMRRYVDSVKAGIFYFVIKLEIIFDLKNNLLKDNFGQLQMEWKILKKMHGVGISQCRSGTK